MFAEHRVALTCWISAERARLAERLDALSELEAAARR
jgi:hypothetical protein